MVAEVVAEAVVFMVAGAAVDSTAADSREVEATSREVEATSREAADTFPEVVAAITARLRRAPSMAVLGAAPPPMPIGAVRRMEDPAAWVEDRWGLRAVRATVQTRARAIWVGVPAREDRRAADFRHPLLEQMASGTPSQEALPEQEQDAAQEIQIWPGRTVVRPERDERRIQTRVA